MIIYYWPVGIFLLTPPLDALIRYLQTFRLDIKYFEIN